MVRDGLLVHYAPGLTMPADTAREASMRGAAIAQLAPAAYTAVTRTALWIHTGYLLRGQPPLLTLSHPRTSTTFNASRRHIPSERTVTIGGMKVTDGPLTCLDFLLLEAPAVAAEAITALCEAGLADIERIDAELISGPPRRGKATASKLWELMRKTLSAHASHAPSLTL